MLVDRINQAIAYFSRYQLRTRGKPGQNFSHELGETIYVARVGSRPEVL